MQLFLDANAHVPISPAAISEFLRFNNDIAAHGHALGLSAPSRQAAYEIEMARAIIAESIGADSSQIYFTSGCTQACAWGLEILNNIKSFPIASSPMEHQSVRDNIKSNFETVNVSKDGIISYDEFNSHSAICIYIQNEIGTINELNKITSDIIFSDMCQGLGKIPLDLSKLPNVKIATFGAHKFGGSPGIGFLFLRDSEMWEEFGAGSRYFLDRPGTPDAIGIAISAAALREAIKTQPERYENMVRFRDVLESGLESLGFEIIAKNSNRIPNTTFVRVGNERGPDLLVKLSDRKIYVGLGSACGSMHTGDNPLMQALGCGGHMSDFLRISQFGEYSAKHAEYFLDVLKNCYDRG